MEVSVEAEATKIPEAVEVDISGLEIDSQVLAKDLKLPEGTSLAAEEDLLILQILDASAATEPEAAEEAAAEEGAEGEAAE